MVEARKYVICADTDRGHVWMNYTSAFPLCSRFNAADALEALRRNGRVIMKVRYTRLASDTKCQHIRRWE